MNKKVRKCKKCGLPIYEKGIQYHTGCRQSKIRYCPRCGKVLPNKLHYCPECRLPRKRYNADNSAFVLEHQGKYFCACGCGQAIVIKRHHQWKDIPRYLTGHRGNKQYLIDCAKIVK